MWIPLSFLLTVLNLLQVFQDDVNYLLSPSICCCVALERHFVISLIAFSRALCSATLCLQNECKEKTCLREREPEQSIRKAVMSCCSVTACNLEFEGRFVPSCLLLFSPICCYLSIFFLYFSIHLHSFLECYPRRRLILI